MWSPISLDEMSELIRIEEAKMNPLEERLWCLLRVRPAKWQLHPWGDNGGGFWVMGVIGGHVIWYNDIEDGFNVSRYLEQGNIAEYWCNQDGLPLVLRGLLDFIESGVRPGKLGPPRPIDYSA